MADSLWRGTYDDIVASAMRTSGLDDFGGSEHEEGLRVLVDDYRDHAGLTEAGCKWMRGNLKGLLVARLMAERGFKDHPDHADVTIEQPLFVIGLPRSGTTLVQRLLTADPGAQGLEQWLVDLPQPRPPRETWAEHPVFSMMQAGFEAYHQSNPELAGIHYSDATTHEECWRLLQQSGRSVAFETQAHVPSYSAWLQTADWLPAYERHKRLLQLIGLPDSSKRWVLKNPSHMVALDALLEVYPDARIVVTHRDPVACVASMCSLSEVSTRGLSTTFVGETIGRTQLDLLVREQAAFADARERVGEDRFIDVEYDGLVGDPVGTIAAVHERFDLPWDDGVAAVVRAELEESRKGPRAPRHDYDLADYGLTEEQVREALAE